MTQSQQLQKRPRVATSQTVRARFRAYRFPEKTPHGKENKEGLMHFAAGQLCALLKCSSCCPWPCMPLSGTPWEVVTPPTHYGSSVTLPLARGLGDPVVRRYGTC